MRQRQAFALLLEGRVQSAKGMSCTDKNTVVFVVVEGEITVVVEEEVVVDILVSGELS
jgi:hypothetical protein